MQLPLTLDSSKLAEIAGHAVDDLDHWLSAHAGQLVEDVEHLLGEHLAAVDVKADNAATVDESTPAVVDHGAVPAGDAGAGSTQG